ncbi:hypothetical protein BGX29_006064 [Mortierella sp. GBA35]|nr:hypothetical protein BGX29_006064 [Mortierella sp. GBA35]
MTTSASAVSTPTTRAATSPRSTLSSPTFSSPTTGSVVSEQDEIIVRGLPSPGWKRLRTQSKRLSTSSTTRSGSRRSETASPISSDPESDTLSGPESDSHTLSDSRVPEIAFVDMSNDEGSGAEYDAASERGFGEERDSREVLVDSPVSYTTATTTTTTKTTPTATRPAVTQLDTFGATRGRYLHHYHPHHPLAKTTSPTKAAPGGRVGHHTHTRNFSSPSLLDSFMSPEPILSPIQSYFGSDPNSPVSSFSLPRHDHYPRLTIDPYMDPNGASMLMDGYHGFATHPWSEQSTTPSRALSHRWTRRSSHPETLPHHTQGGETTDATTTDVEKETTTVAAQAAAAAVAASSMGMCGA